MKVLQFTCYPIDNPTHGGQIRCWQIREFLKKNGCTVSSMAIYPIKDYESISPDDVEFNFEGSSFHPKYNFLTDYYSGLEADKKGIINSAIYQKIVDYNPDLIFIEQPWLFLAVKNIINDIGKNVPIIYSSQNIEWRLKEADLSIYGEVGDDLVNKIKTLESQVVESADGIIACTQADAEYFKKISKGKEHIIVAGNGVEEFTCTDESVSQWIDYFSKPYPVFVGSAHPPNARGIWEMVNPGLTFLSPEEELVVIGGVCNILMKDNLFKKTSELNISRLHLVGVRTKLELQAMVRASHVVLLPITIGEGSNLKTAEALESGRPIVGTSMAFRGFEEAKKLPHVYIADNSSDFRKITRILLNSPRYISGTQESIRSKYYWNNTLKSISFLLKDNFA